MQAQIIKTQQRKKMCETCKIVLDSIKDEIAKSRKKIKMLEDHQPSQMVRKQNIDNQIKNLSYRIYAFQEIQDLIDALEE